MNLVVTYEVHLVVKGLPKATTFIWLSAAKQKDFDVKCDVLGSFTLY